MLRSASQVRSISCLNGQKQLAFAHSSLILARLAKRYIFNSGKTCYLYFLV
ncbi:Putative uncharacterized protein [Moritella viscosa]|nr:Putative uncharacterized protein [Moritella viscosa]